MPDSIAKQIRAEIDAEIKAKREPPPTAGQMIHGLVRTVSDPVGRIIPERFKEEWNRPILGPITHGDVLLGGPLGGLLIGGGIKLLRGGLRAARPATQIGPRLIRDKVPSTQQTIAEALEELRAPRADAVQLPLGHPGGGGYTVPPPANPNAGGRVVLGGGPRQATPIGQAISEGLEASLQQPSGVSLGLPARRGFGYTLPPELPTTYPRVTLSPRAKAVSAGRQPPPMPSASEELFRQLSRKTVLTPQEAQQLEQLGGMLRKRASNVGLSYAAGGKGGETGQISERLLRTLGLGAAGSAIGGAVDSDNPLRGALIGAAGGAALGHPRKALEIANQLRVGSMLSGAAIPKNILGSAQAVGSAALEGASLQPIREALRVPTNLRHAVSAFRQSANPSAIAGAGGVNIPGRIIGAIDDTTRQALERAGGATEDIQRLLLTKPNEAAKALRLTSPVGRAFFPFQRTPFNVFAEGFNPANVNTPRKALLTAGMVGGSAVGGKQIADSDMTRRQKMLSLGLLSAALGPRALPGMVAAGLSGAGSMATSGLTPVPEWAFPSSLSKAATTMTGITPAALRVKETLQERRARRRSRRRS